MWKYRAGMILFAAAIVTIGLVIAIGQQPGNAPPTTGDQRQALQGAVIQQLTERHQDLTYEGLRAALPFEPRYRAALDFDPTQARYFDVIQKELELTDEELAIYRRNGFVSLDNGRRYTYTTAYYEIYAADLPVLITSDSILHALHKSYDEILKELETTWFSWTLDEMLLEVQQAVADEAARNGDATLAANYRDVDLYVTVARNLLAGAGAPAPRGQERGLELGRATWDGKLVFRSVLGQDEEVLARLQDIQSLRLPDALQDAPTQIYGGERFIDFSQFRPRGHYTKSTLLQNYFRSMMWLSRADTGWNVLPTAATPAVDSNDRRELRDAALLVQLIRRTGNLERLRSIDQVIGYLVGSSDSLNVFQLEELTRDAAITDAGGLVDARRLEALQKAIRESAAARQLIRSQIVVSDPADTYKVPPPATFQMFGQRFAIDSHVLSNVVYDSVIFQGRKQRRMMPGGLDVAAALGNDAAVPLLEDELRKWNYSANLLAGREFVEQQDQQFWNGNVYSMWLNCLRELDGNLVEQPHAPQAMQTRAWQMKQLQTELASWSELRHDTILYTKQSYTGVPGCEYLDGYVEPYPEFYAGVAALAERARELIAETPYKSGDAGRNATLRVMRGRQVKFFATMAAHVGRLEALARKELAAEPFSEEERQFVARTINHRGSVRFGSGSRPTYDGWYTELFYSPDGLADSTWEATVADVHTDPESRQVLEVGVGNLNLCVIAVDNEDDRTAYVGPVFSYYEFLQPAEARLTDGEWNAMLWAGKQAPRPAWVASFAARKADRSNLRSSATLSKREGDLVIYSVKERSKYGITGRSRQLELSDRGLRSLAEIPWLRTLDLSRANVTDAGLEHLGVLDDLRNLNLTGTKIDGRGLASLEQAAWLRVLVLSDTDVSDSALAHLKKLPRLEVLDLSGTKVTNAGVEQLREMTYLRELIVERTGIDQAGLDRLRAALPKCDIRG